jgi:hypothetical protein
MSDTPWSPAAALPLDLAAKLSRKDLDQPAADPGIRGSRIDPLAVIGTIRRSCPGMRFGVTTTEPLVSIGKRIFDGIRYELMELPADRILWGDRECVAKATVGEPDRPVGLQHEQAFTDRLDQIQGVYLSHGRLLRAFR